MERSTREIEQSVRKSFELVRHDIAELKKQRAQQADILEELKAKLNSRVSVDEFYEKIRQLIEEMEKTVHADEFLSLREEEQTYRRELKKSVKGMIEQKADITDIEKLKDEVEKLSWDKTSKKEFYKQNYMHVQEIVALSQKVRELEKLISDHIKSGKVQVTAEKNVYEQTH